MSDEEAQFGTESPDARDLVDIPEPSRKKGKGKGGKTKGVNNARGIPESVRKRLGYDTPPEENFQQRKNRLQGIRRYWAVRWYKYKSIPDWSGQCNLLSMNLICTLWQCILLTILRIATCTTRSHPTNLTRTPF